MAEPLLIRSALSFLRPARRCKVRSGTWAPKAPRLQHRGVATAAAIQETDYDREIPTPTTAQSARRETIRDAKPFSAFLTDNFNRQHDYLRISITERCNLRCLYCMPEEGVPLSPAAHLLTSPEIVYLSSLFVNQGVTKIRLTGGEPTVRKDIVPLMRSIGELRRDGLKELCLTTNGISLHRKLDSMVESGLTGVNLSLDTLDPFQFQIMTRRKGFDAVWRSIERILEMNKLGAGIKLKINCVVMRGLNEREILPFVELGREKDIETRFIEYMPFDGNKWSEGKMLPYKEMLAVIREKYPTLEKVQDHKNDTSKTFRIPGFVGKIGFITSMTHNFCGTCNRLRITGDGNLKVCLFGNAEVSLRDLLRNENNGKPIDEEAMEAIKKVEMNRREALSGSTGTLGMSETEMGLLDVIGMAVKRKAAKHAGLGELENMKNRPMILIDETPSANATSIFKSASNITSVPQLHHSLFSSPTLWKSIPTYILPTQTMSHISSPRYYSTSSKRSSSSEGTPYRSQVKSSRSNPESPSRTPDASITQQGTPYHPHHPKPSHLPHLTASSTAHMIPIHAKPETLRTATAIASVLFSNLSPYNSIIHHSNKKGDVLAVTRLAGIQGAKKCPDLIPLAHPVSITGVEVQVEPIAPAEHEDEKSRSDFGKVVVTATVSTVGRTGVEMEALSAVTVAALTVFDMCKGADRGMQITGARVVRKDGGMSGTWFFGEKAWEGEEEENGQREKKE